MAASAEALVAHVLRRCAIAPTPALITRFVGTATDPRQAASAAIDWALSAPAQSALPAQMPKDGWEANLFGWATNLRSPNAGLHERMTWFWHGHMPVGGGKVGNVRMLHANQQMLRTHALGNFATMMHAILKDAATLFMLDLSGSSVAAPNENFARELMELFTTGPGVYTEDDVKAGALALAGYEVDYESGAITRNPERSLGGEVVFLGRRGRLTPDDVIDTVLAHEATAGFVAGKIHHHLAGVQPSPEVRAELAKMFRSSGWEIRPVVEAILRSPAFLDQRLNRAKFPIEWWVGALHSLLPFRPNESTDLNAWFLNDLDQMPNDPPNVAGWPITSRWLASDQQLARAAYVRSVSWRCAPLVIPPGGDLVAATLARCSLYEVSDRTMNVLRNAALATAGQANELTITRRLLTAALCSPEFALA
jgi:uncharacterized protein (DUF1800 family)